MAVRYINGGTLGGNWGGIAGRFSGLCLYTNGSGHTSEVLPPSDTYIVGVSCFPNASTQNLMGWYEGGVLHVKLYLAGGKLRAYRGTGTGALLGEGVATIATGAWVGIEAKVKVHDSAGTVEVHLNGDPTPDLILSGIDTRNGGATGLVDQVNLGADGGAASYFSDWRALDLVDSGIVGMPNNDFIGDVRVETRFPTAEGFASDFTPLSGTDNALMVDDTDGSDSDTTYNASSTVGAKDTHALENLATVSGVVHAIAVSNRWRKDDAGTRVAHRVIRTGGIDFEGPDAVLGSSYSQAKELLEANPNTVGAWTIAEINALEAGYKVQS